MKVILINEICNEKPNSQALGAFNEKLGRGIGNNIDTSNVKINDIFKSLGNISNNTNNISSIGEYVSNINIQSAQNEINKIANYLNKSSLAYKIIKHEKNFSFNKGFSFSDKQKWVIAYELEKNPKYKQEVAKIIKENKKPSFQEIRKKQKREEKKKNKGAYVPPSWLNK